VALRPILSNGLPFRALFILAEIEANVMPIKKTPSTGGGGHFLFNVFSKD
jgi:hypothetical protein